MTMILTVMVIKMNNYVDNNDNIDYDCNDDENNCNNDIDIAMKLVMNHDNDNNILS